MAAMTVGQLRDKLADLDAHLPVRLVTASRWDDLDGCILITSLAGTALILSTAPARRFDPPGPNTPPEPRLGVYKGA